MKKNEIMLSAEKMDGSAKHHFKWNDVSFCTWTLDGRGKDMKVQGGLLRMWYEAEVEIRKGNRSSEYDQSTLYVCM
jgi:hypothetical protein